MGLKLQIFLMNVWIHVISLVDSIQLNLNPKEREGESKGKADDKAGMLNWRKMNGFHSLKTQVHSPSTKPAQPLTIMSLDFISLHHYGCELICCFMLVCKVNKINFFILFTWRKIN